MSIYETYLREDNARPLGLDFGLGDGDGDRNAAWVTILERLEALRTAESKQEGAQVISVCRLPLSESQSTFE